MEVVYYFTQANVRLDELTALAEIHGYESTRTILTGTEELKILYSGKDEADVRYWMFIPISEAEGDWNEFGPSEREVVTDYNSMSAFLVVHPPGSWPTLRVFLRDLLLEYGGWVGSASDN